MEDHERGLYLFNNYVISTRDGPIVIILSYLEITEMCYFSCVSKVFHRAVEISVKRLFTIQELYSLNVLHQSGQNNILVNKIIQNNDFLLILRVNSNIVISKNSTFRDVGILSAFIEKNNLNSISCMVPGSLEMGKALYIKDSEFISDYFGDNYRVTFKQYPFTFIMKIPSTTLDRLHNSGYFIHPKFIEERISFDKNSQRILMKILDDYKIYDFCMNKNPAIQYFLKNWAIKMVSFFIKNGVAKEKAFKNPNFSTPKSLVLGIVNSGRDDRFDFLEYFMDVFPDYLSPNIVNERGDTILHLLVLKKKKQLIEKMIGYKGFNCDDYKFNNKHETPLYIACSMRLFEIVEILVSAGYDVNERNKDGFYAIQHFMNRKNLSRDSIRIIKCLVLNGAFLDFSIRGFTFASFLLHEFSKSKDWKFKMFKDIFSYIVNQENFQPLFKNVMIQKTKERALHLAASVNFMKLLEFCYYSDPSLLNSRTYRSETPIFNAVYEKDYESMKFLIEVGAEVKGLVNSEKRNLLHILFLEEYCLEVKNDELSLKMNKLETKGIEDVNKLRDLYFSNLRNCFDLLYDEGIDINQLDMNLRRPMYYVLDLALEDSDFVNICVYMIQKGAEFEDCFTLDHLNIACRENRTEILDIMKENNIPLDLMFGEVENETIPLHIACSIGNISFFRKLVELSEDNIEIRDEMGRTPVLCSCTNLHSQSLIQNSKNSRKSKKEENSPFGVEKKDYIELEKRKLEILKCLITKFDAKVFVLDKKKRSPLFYSIQNSFYSITGFLLSQLEENQRIFHLRDICKKQRNCVLRAIKFSASTELIELLILAGVDHNFTCKDGKKKNCFHHLVEKGRLDVIKFLLENSRVVFTINERDIQKMTPIQIAFQNKNMEIVNYLLNQKRTRINTSRKFRENLKKMNLNEEMEGEEDSN